MKRTITKDNIVINYYLLTKSVKNINMRIDKSGEIVVTANRFVPISKVDDFVLSKLSWVIKHLKNVRRINNLMNSNDSVLYFGKSYPLSAVSSTHNRIMFENDAFTVYAKEGSDAAKIVESYLDKQFLKHIRTRIEVIYEKFYRDYRLPFPDIKYRRMTKRFGSCTPAKNLLTFNKNLVHYHPDFIDYVIIHEFAHFIVPNHSKSFYQVVAKYMSNYKEISKMGENLLL
ncbi:MAG: M48 family metallopeptidase [Erysipelotrichaceae bacterium]|nr:M48 family metallopeptidase [Erysipelotrichaceae bacterium]